MSGAAGGVAILPVVAVLAAPAILFALTGGALYLAGSAVQSAAQAYEEKRRREREMIRQSGLIEDIASFRQAIKNEMDAQTRLNAQTSQNIMAEMERHRKEMEHTLSDSDPTQYREYLGSIERSRAEFHSTMTKMQENFANGYRARIADTMKEIGKVVNGRVAGNLAELREIGEADARKKDAAKKIASTYIEEAESLISSLREDFGGRDFSARDMDRLGAELNSAEAQFDVGSYEAAAAVAKNVSLGALNEIFEADRKRQEWENYHKHAILIATEIKTYLEAQAEITPELKAKMEEKAGHALDDELIGIKIGEYTDVLETGETLYDHLLTRASKALSELEAASPSNLSLSDLKRTIAELGEKLYPKAMTVVYNGMNNVNNAFMRRGLGEKIIDFFEEHNFNFGGYGYEDDDQTKTLYIGLENDTTGEELIISLAPDLTARNGVGVKVEIDQIGGDETNEERKAFYRESVGEAVTGGIPGAKCRLECDKTTLNKLSAKTDLKEKLKAGTSEK